MEENKDKNCVDGNCQEDKPTEAPQKIKIAIPTQKTLSFYTLINSDKAIDKKVNEWLKNQSLNKQTPMLGKVTSHMGLFGKKLVYVFLYSTYVEVEKSK